MDAPFGSKGGVGMLRSSRTVVLDAPFEVDFLKQKQPIAIKFAGVVVDVFTITISEEIFLKPRFACRTVKFKKFALFAIFENSYPPKEFFDD